MMRIDRRTRRTRRTAVVLATAAALLGGAGAAQATTGEPGADQPSACRPANHLAKITDGGGSAGHHHYRVTLTAPEGYAPCELKGSPADVRFSRHGQDTGLTAGSHGDQGRLVTFGPGRPVHFDIQVRAGAGAVAADEASFTLRSPDGDIPGTSVAEGPLKVARGTLIGPVESGA